MDNIIIIGMVTKVQRQDSNREIDYDCCRHCLSQKVVEVSVKLKT